MSRYTVGDFLDAMKKNGYPQIEGELYLVEWVPDDSDLESGGDYIVYPERGGCALGQALFNLFPEMPRQASENSSFSEKIFEKINAVTGESFTSDIVDLNDEHRKPIPEIVEQIRAHYANVLEEVFYED